MQVFNDQIRGVNAQAYLATLLGEKKESFVTSLVGLVSDDANLQKCAPMSVVYAAVKSVPLGLPIEKNLGYAAVIPYGTSASFQIMRNGWVELAMRTGQVKRLANEPVYEGELVRRNRFTDTYEFDETKRISNKVIGYMAYIQLTNGFEKTIYWSVEEVKAHALRFSQTYKQGRGVWKDNFDAMALKTVLKRLITKYCPKTVELSAAIRDDQTVTDAANRSSYADREPDEQAQPQDAGKKALDKAAEAKAKAASARSRRAAQQEPAAPAPEPEPEPQDGAPEPAIDDLPPADEATGEIFNQ